MFCVALGINQPFPAAVNPGGVAVPHFVSPPGCAAGAITDDATATANRREVERLTMAQLVRSLCKAPLCELQRGG